MNKRKIPLYIAFSFALSGLYAPVSAQYIPLTDLPEVPLQMNEGGQLIQAYPQSGAAPVSDELSLEIADSLNLEPLDQTLYDAPYGQISATPIEFQTLNQAATVPAGSTGASGLTSSAQSDAATDGGWQGLANLLQKLEPKVDTSLPETRSQLSNRINALINAGRYQAALDEINKVFSSTGYIESPGEDVQLRFLEARAYSGLGQSQQALARYKDLNSKYPELPEPYNNLAALQMSLGLLDEAYESLSMATTLRPNYGLAQRNLAMVHLLKAQQSFEIAAKQRVAGAAEAAQSIRQIIERGQSK
ncbi:MULTISPECIES: hypothetical protein [Oligella]|uniref:hypothetical protein n=1 Tax=Oligella TaxID=90243 RepID=UPI0008A4A76D|nr:MULTISPECIES: hypothetical protein [Oligella]OFV50617.1 hypothetical protein HMPREF3179_02395 [Oligella sp. HMSC09E12]SUA59822.1 Flp pilus assembly protein TadD, contains TPR repeats [Oligella urethralis]